MGILERLTTASQNRRGWLIDVALALVTSVIGVFSILSQALAPGMHEPDAFCVVMAVGACSTILGWRRYPVGGTRRGERCSSPSR